MIDWFQPWPESSLHSVARKFLDEVDLGDDALKAAVVEFMPFRWQPTHERPAFQSSKFQLRDFKMLVLISLWMRLQHPLSSPTPLSPLPSRLRARAQHKDATSAAVAHASMQAHGTQSKKEFTHLNFKGPVQP